MSQRVVTSIESALTYYAAHHCSLFPLLAGQKDPWGIIKSFADDCSADPAQWDTWRILVKPSLAIVTPTTVNRTVGPLRRPNAELGDEIRALRKLQRESAASSFVFVSERGSPFSTAGFAKMIERVGAASGLDFKAHPHMLRHACGFALANAGHDTRALQAYLGHKNIQHTVRYTELAPNRFKDFWRS
jgi:integrase